MLNKQWWIRMGLICLVYLADRSCSYAQPSANDQPLSQSALKTIIVDNYAPYTFVNQQGQPDGFSVDLLNAVVQAMGMTVTIRADTWDYALKALQNGEIDVLPMMAHSHERDQLFDFSAPHTIAYDALFTRRNSPKVRSLDDVRGKTIIVMNNDQAHQYLQMTSLFPPDHLILVDSLPDALRQLASGAGDVALMPKLVGLMHVKNLHLTNLDPAPVVIEVYNRPFSFAVREGNQDLLERLTQGVQIVKTTEQYDAIYDKWFGVLEAFATWHTMLKYIGGIGLIFLLISAIPILWSFSLKRQVALRTQRLELEIQERKRAEEALQESEERFRAAFEHASIGLVLTAPDGQMLRINQAFCTMLGYGIDDIQGHNFAALTHPEDLKISQECVRCLLAGEQATYHFNKRYLHRLGQEIWTEVHTALLRDSQGQPLYFITHIQDITERRRMETALQENEMIFSSFLEHSPVYVFFKDREIRSLRLSKNYEQMLGMPINALLGKSMDELFPSELARSMVADDRRILEQGEVVKIEEEFNGHTYETTKFPILKDGTPYMLAGFTLDITDRKRAEEALRESERLKTTLLDRLNEAQQLAMVGSWDWDLQTNAVWWSDETYRMFGVTSEEYTPNFETNTQFIHPRDLPAYNERFAHSLKTGEPLEYDFRLFQRNGNIKYCYATGKVLYDNFGKKTHFIGTVMDITERKKAEEQIREHNRLLEEAVQRKQREMEMLFDKLLRQEKLATIGQMAGSIAHELRNPLGAVKNSIYYLKRLAQTQQLTVSNPKVLRHLELINTELDTSEQVIADLLEMTRMKPLQRQSTDFRALTEDVVQRCHLPWQVRVTMTIEPEPLTLDVDPVQFRQVLLNVLTNAAQAIEGEGTITIHAKQLTEPAESVITIHDTGIGIAPDALLKVFEPLYTTKANGTGLGLPICKEIIERHQGRISLISQPGEGTTVTMVLPRH